MFNSIRWSMLGWQAVILSLVVAGFGMTFYRQVRHARYEEIDADLLGVAQSVAVSLQAGRTPAIPESYRTRFGKKPEDQPYLHVWDAAGDVTVRAAIEPEVPLPKNPDKPRPHPYAARERPPYREAILRTANGSQILVGRSVRKERDELSRLLGWTLGAGITVTALGLAGGWLMSARVLAPVARMSQAAERISARNLSQRLDAGSARSELGRLARVLNDMFDRLQAAFERQARFTADASHELRTPVAIMLAQVEQALARERSGEEYRESLEACLRSARRMKMLVDDMLVLARADAGQAVLRRKIVDLASVVEGAAALAAPLAVERQVEVHLRLQPLATLADPEQLGQVALNLLSNAIHYNRPHGEVLVSLGKDGDRAVLRVENTGEGIAPEHLNHIFEPFYRADAARTSRGGSSGLGLAICREIVAAHGGEIAVKSQPGSGCEFQVRLPIRGEAEGDLPL